MGVLQWYLFELVEGTTSEYQMWSKQNQCIKKEDILVSATTCIGIMTTFKSNY